MLFHTEGPIHLRPQFPMLLLHIVACCLVGTKPLSDPLLNTPPPRNQLQWNLNRNSNIFIQGNPFHNIVWKMVATLSRPHLLRFHLPYTYHYADVIMIEMASQITSLAILYSIVYSDADQRKHQTSASLAFVRGIHRSPVNSPHKWPVTRKMFPFDDVIMVKVSSAAYILFGSCVPYVYYVCVYMFCNMLLCYVFAPSLLFVLCILCYTRQYTFRMIMALLTGIVYICIYRNVFFCKKSMKST